MTLTLLKKRLIPKLLIKYRKIGSVTRPVLVTTKQYKETYDVGDAVSQAKIYEAQLADELIVLNINGTTIGDDATMLNLVERLACETFMPLAVGGGVCTLADFSTLLQYGADKVCINSKAISHPNLISEAASRFGSQCVVVSIDFQKDAEGRYVVFQPQLKQSSKIDVVEWAQEVAKAGAGEILLTDVERDGLGLGLNYAIGRIVAEAVPIPVILSGGCGLIEHFAEGFQQGGVEAVAAGTFFSFRDQNPMQLRAHLRNEGISIRMNT
ncbi:putative imidazole glycerol phosphate synthase,cyclase subunit (HisF) [Legionella lansingensis]|uniref:imidazole glycerol-phosphate synthase n=1 Tax=Legionella lansingensis TaxID=45067 RepID=A0A0W0VW72_9GAMM|nr:imidazole glycerol phosphate synthase cyclase subunit [Legionella lansingensis]KTD24309.1 putative imidazole glycerol phosphate synthase,cyclase subunit (HisF) [Legionella lansingensis]SNV51836.1 putative imidazole glycerol phosphate synthase,cyclase subunit (HisF) [Legionella lansingensis]